jgi:hypothetical protein
MPRVLSWLTVIVAVVLAVPGGMAISAQDKYTLQVPDGLSFFDFRGYESWQVVSVAKTDEVLKVIVANTTMIDAYRAGVPGNGKLFPTAPRLRRSSGPRKRVPRRPFP